jgi:type IV secretion system protein VirB9
MNTMHRLYARAAVFAALSTAAVAVIAQPSVNRGSSNATTAQRVAAAPTNEVVTPPTQPVALSVPVPGGLDPRVRTYAFTPDVVYQLMVTVGMHTHIPLAQDERLIERPKLGETIQWRVTGNAKNIYIKALKEGAATSMTLVTDRRIYQFELVATTDVTKRIQLARFTYPDDEERMALEAERAERDAENVRADVQRRREATELSSTSIDPERIRFYTVTGDAAFRPSAVFDDGTFTYFRLPRTQDLPAIFAVGADGKLTPINYVIRPGGEQAVMERISPQWVMKLGSTEVKVTAADRR